MLWSWRNQGPGNPTGVPLIPKSRREKDSKGHSKTLSQSWPDTCLPPWLPHTLAPRTNHFSVIFFGSSLKCSSQNRLCHGWNKHVEPRNTAACRAEESTRHGPLTRTMGSHKSVLSPGLCLFLRTWEVGLWEFWGPVQLCDLSKLPIEGKTPELPVQKRSSFALHSVAKGPERGYLLACIETKVIKHTAQSMLGSVLPSPSRSIQEVVSALAEERT